MPNQDPNQNINLSAGLTPKQPVQDSGIDLSAGLVAKPPAQANPSSEAEMFAATTGAPTPSGQQMQPTHRYDPNTKTIVPVTSPSSVGQSAWDETKSLAKGAAQPF